MIMERYKEELNNIHAPEDLIMKTLLKVHEEEAKVEEEKRAAETVVTETVKAETNVTDFASHKSNKNRYKLFITVGSTLAAAALILLIAKGMRSTGDYSATDTASDTATSTYTETADFAEDAAAEDSYDNTMSEMAADDSYDDAAAADDSDYMEATTTADTYDDMEADYSDDADDSDDSKHTKQSGVGLLYNPLTGPGYKAGTSNVSSAAATSNSDEGNVTIEDYSSYAEYDMNLLVSRLSTASQKYYITENEDGSIKNDRALIEMYTSGQNATLALSKTTELASDELLQGMRTTVAGNEVRLGEYEEYNTYYAAFRLGEMNAVLIGREITKDEFESILADILNE